MTTLSDQSRLLIDFNIWADERILDAAAGLSDEQFGGLRGQLAHMLGTMVWWHGNWTGHPLDDDVIRSTTTDAVTTFDSTRAAYARAHDDLRSFAAALDDDGWNRSERWWQRWGENGELSVGELIVQVVNHGTQHRSEIAVVLSLANCSPGDLDYLNFRLPQIP